ncbi:MAG: formyltetrahydrofolate deformylase [Verrucomicrobiota bacterium]|nr:formyltetrahydrofolate deformylase [Verrucomicrobiota bacterium]
MKERFILTLSCEDRIGIVAKVSTFLADYSAFILESAQFSDLETGRFFLRCVFHYEKKGLDKKAFSKLFTPLSQELSCQWQLHAASEKTRVLLLVSNQSHCLNDLLYRMQNNLLSIEIAAIVSNHQNLKEMASWYKIPFHYLPVTPQTKVEQEEKILQLVHSLSIDLVVLARYMQILSPRMTKQIFGRAINIHHSFLPSFKGAKPYHQAFERGVKLIGATAHYVNDELDEGPIIEQEVLRVDHTLTADQFVQVGKDVEAQVLARAIKAHTEHRVFLNGLRTVIFK